MVIDTRTICDDICEELHKPTRKIFPRRSIIVKGICELLQADLIDLSAFSKLNSGFKFLLVVVDVFSKVCHVEPLKSKSGEEVSGAMRRIIKKYHRKIFNLETDRAKEFFCKPFKRVMDALEINHYATNSTMKVRPQGFFLI